MPNLRRPRQSPLILTLRLQVVAHEGEARAVAVEDVVVEDVVVEDVEVEDVEVEDVVLDVVRGVNCPWRLMTRVPHLHGERAKEPKSELNSVMFSVY